jgi:hypothetical protein
MIFRIRPHGPTEININAPDADTAFQTYMKLLTDAGFEIYQAIGGSGLAGETLAQAEKGPSKIIKPDFMPPKIN